MKKLTKKGQKFIFQRTMYTAESFFGATGIEYDTLRKAKYHNEKGSLICVKNKEYGGASKASECQLVSDDFFIERPQ